AARIPRRARRRRVGSVRGAPCVASRSPWARRTSAQLSRDEQRRETRAKQDGTKLWMRAKFVEPSRAVRSARGKKRARRCEMQERHGFDGTNKTTMMGADAMGRDAVAREEIAL